MEEEKIQPKLRIIDVERKIAAQISDVWSDMKVHLKNKMMSTKNRMNLTPQPVDSSVPIYTASSQNHS